MDMFLHGFLFICLILKALAQTPVVIITSPSTSTGQLMANSPQTLTCRVINRIDQPVEWYFWGRKSNKGRQLTRNLQVLTPQHYSVDHPSNSPESWRLTIKNVQPQNAGRYMCRVWTSTNRDIRDTVEMDYVEPPQVDFSQSSQSAVVLEGEPYELRCVAYGTPNVTIIWSRIGGALLPAGGVTYRGSVLRIPSVRPEHRGTYTCTARNVVGTATLSLNLGVKFLPQVSSEHSLYRQKSGHDKQLACYVQSNPAVHESSVSWFFNGRQISSSDKYYVSFLRGANYRATMQLYIRDISSSDYGDYRCSAAAPTDDSVQRSDTARLEESAEETPVGGVVLAGSALRANTLLLAAVFWGLLVNSV